MVKAIEQALQISGPCGELEAHLIASQPLAELTRFAVVCHPHPVHGGTMTNKVVTSAARALRDNGCGVLTFNFRGVGNSAGTYDEARGEVDDLLAVLTWLRAEPGLAKAVQRLTLAGFSFGSFIAASVAAQQACEQVILIAPPVHHFAFEQLAPLQAPCTVIQGDADEIVPPELVYTYVAAQTTQAGEPWQLQRLADTSHFFHGKLLQLKALISTL